MRKLIGDEAHWHCDNCAGRMYRVNAAGGVLWDEAIDGPELPTSPIKLIVGNRIWHFCNKPCAVEWIEGQPEGELRQTGFTIL